MPPHASPSQQRHNKAMPAFDAEMVGGRHLLPASSRLQWSSSTVTHEGAVHDGSYKRWSCLARIYVSLRPQNNQR